MQPRSRLLIMLGLLATLLAAVGPAVAQGTLPRIGISAARDHYLDSIEVENSEEIFTLYACVFGPESGEPLDLSLHTVRWVVHQACCGATINILDVVYNPALEHTGHPLLGVQSTAPLCVNEDGLLLATITASLEPTLAGELLWAAGPFGPAEDCVGEQPLFLGLPVTIIYQGGVLPDEATSWGSVKSTYR